MFHWCPEETAAVVAAIAPLSYLFARVRTWIARRACNDECACQTAEPVEQVTQASDSQEFR